MLGLLTGTQALQEFSVWMLPWVSRSLDTLRSHLWSLKRVQNLPDVLELSSAPCALDSRSCLSWESWFWGVTTSSLDPFFTAEQSHQLNAVALTLKRNLLRFFWDLLLLRPTSWDATWGVKLNLPRTQLKKLRLLGFIIQISQVWLHRFHLGFWWSFWGD